MNNQANAVPIADIHIAGWATEFSFAARHPLPRKPFERQGRSEKMQSLMVRGHPAPNLRFKALVERGSDDPGQTITFGFSHFCEKARWALDWHGIAYQEIGWPPGVHRILAKRCGAKGTTLPILLD